MIGGFGFYTYKYREFILNNRFKVFFLVRDFKVNLYLKNTLSFERTPTEFLNG